MADFFDSNLWKPPGVVRDLAINLLAGVVIFIVGLQWTTIRALLSLDHRRFRKLFGRRAVESGEVFIVQDTFRDLRLLDPAAQRALGVVPPQAAAPNGARFFKTFPDGHLTWFSGPTQELTPYCSARAASYLLESFSPLRGVRARVSSDYALAAEWEAAVVTIGSSASNIKTDDLKHHPQNLWLQDDLQGTFTFKDGTPAIAGGQRSDKGVILKVRDPYFRGYSAIVCAGLGEWGTSGAAWFLARNWRALSRRFGPRPFLVVVDVVPGTDQSAREILSLGQEVWWRRAKRWFRTHWRAPHGS